VIRAADQTFGRAGWVVDDAGQDLRVLNAVLIRAEQKGAQTEADEPGTQKQEGDGSVCGILILNVHWCA
jgi:glycerol-3-phosphate dehydrogenase